MPRIRLLMSVMPPMLGDVISALAAKEPDVEVVGHVGRDADLAAAIDECRAEAVVIGALDSNPAVCEQLLMSHPRLRILILGEGGRVGYLDRLAPQRTVIRDISPEELLDAIRGVGRFR